MIIIKSILPSLIGEDEKLAMDFVLSPFFYVHRINVS
jgi:hypothetical protein